MRRNMPRWTNIHATFGDRHWAAVSERDFRKKIQSTETYNAALWIISEQLSDSPAFWILSSIHL